MADFTIAEAKIRILYLVSRVPGIGYHMLMNRCLDQLYTDFFTFSRAYEELIAGNLMDRTYEDDTSSTAIGGTETLTISAGGKAPGRLRAALQQQAPQGSSAGGRGQGSAAVPRRKPHSFP